jgi:ribonuclease R
VLVPQDPRLTVRIVVPRGAEGGGRDGDMVVAELVRYPGAESEAEAAVTGVLGPAADPRVETEAVIHAHGLPLEFPDDVRVAARRVPASVPAEALTSRLDLRDQPIVTIDGENARDFDDAVLVERDGRGWRLTVAVADVAHYVPAGSPIDLEARARGTSVYFPDRVIPMLPEELSNGICSLVPGEDRLVKVVRLALDARGRVTGARFADGVIRSAARLTYTEVRQALVDRDPEVRARLGALLPPLELAGELAPLLTEIRRARGALDFDLPEAEVVLDLRGRPENIVRAERSLAHRMIEEFMLAANEAVARELARRRIDAIPSRPCAAGPRADGGAGPLPRRIRAPPEDRPGSPDARRLPGRPREGGGPAGGAARQHRDPPEPHAGGVQHGGARTLRAGNPVVHALHLADPALSRPDGAPPPRRRVRGDGRVPRDLPAIAEESSRRERIAMDAEREIVQLKKVQLMQDKIGESFDGWVSGVAPFGAFVELRDVFVEGLVHVSALGDDFYELVEEQHLLRGRRTRRTFRVGDPVA